MGVFRVNKNKNYTVMSNVHLRDKALPLKAKGLLSLMLSLPEDWDYSMRGLAKLSADGLDSTRAAVKALERSGYVVRRQLYDSRGRFSNNEYTVFEIPQLSSPSSDLPLTGKPSTEKSPSDAPLSEKPSQINTDQVITQKRNTDLNNYQSINLDGMDRMDERSEYEEIIKEKKEREEAKMAADPEYAAMMEARKKEYIRTRTAKRKAEHEALVELAKTDEEAARKLAEKRKYQSEATVKCYQKLKADAEAGDPEAMKRYEAHLAKRREDYHKKKAEKEDIPA